MTFKGDTEKLCALSFRPIGTAPHRGYRGENRVVFGSVRLDDHSVVLSSGIQVIDDLKTLIIFDHREAPKIIKSEALILFGTFAHIPDLIGIYRDLYLVQVICYLRIVIREGLLKVDNELLELKIRFLF